MCNRLYRNHVIMPFPSYDTAANAWAPQADISWCTGPSRESEFVRFPNRFLTKADAITFALRKGEAWIDNRLRRLRSGSEHAVIDMIGALKKSLEKISPAQPPRTRGIIQWYAEKTFTFGQFKSVVVKGGIKPSEQTLQKSYAALVKLRKNKHWSWAQTRQKVEHSQRAAKSPARQQRAARIPLTERDWRRIV
jgi:hypothetical protein